MVFAMIIKNTRMKIRLLAFQKIVEKNLKTEIPKISEIKCFLLFISLQLVFHLNSFSQTNNQVESKITPGNLKVTHSNADQNFANENNLENTPETEYDFSIRQEKLLVSIGKIRNEYSSSTHQLLIEKAVADFKIIDATFPFSDFVKEYSQEKFKAWYQEDNSQNEPIISRLHDLLNELNKQ